MMMNSENSSSTSMGWLDIVESGASEVRYKPKTKKTLQAFYKKRVSSKANAVMIFTARAKTRIGKSYLAIWIALLFYRDFCIDDIVLNIREYLERLKYHKKRYKIYYREFKKTGDWRVFPIVLYDESGVEYGAGDFMAKINKVMGYTLEAYGKYQVTCFMTLPLLAQLDSTGRRMTDIVILVNSRGRGKAYKKKIHPFESDIHYHSFCDIPKREGGKQKKIPLPPKELIDLYEAKKDKQLDDWIIKFQEEIEPKAEQKSIGDRIREDIIDDKINIQKMKKEDIALNYGCSMNYARDFLKLYREWDNRRKAKEDRKDDA